MRETIARFERRTGTRYEPPPRNRLLGEPLGRGASCPTLFRFPGPEGVLAHLQERLGRPGPPERGHVWLTSRPTGACPRPVGLFGTLVLLRPLGLQPCRTHCFTHTRDAWVALNRAPEDGSVAWMAPSLVRSGLDLDRVRTAEDAQRRFGPRAEDERRVVADRLHAYLEEMQELRRAGAPGPLRHWCSVPAAERRAVLDRHGVAPRWTRR